MTISNIKYKNEKKITITTLYPTQSTLTHLWQGKREEEAGGRGVLGSGESKGFGHWQKGKQE